jgi:hypothetical protein
VPTLADNLAFAHHNGPDEGIGRHSKTTALGKPPGEIHK